MEALAGWTAVGLLAWGVVVSDLWFQRRYFAWLLRTARTSIVGATLLTVVVHAVGMLLCVVAAHLINDLVVSAYPMWIAASLFVLVGMVYTPLIGTGVPIRRLLHPYEDVRLALEKAGATLGQERAVAWIGGPLAFLGMVSVLVGALNLFDT